MPSLQTSLNVGESVKLPLWSENAKSLVEKNVSILKIEEVPVSEKRKRVFVQVQNGKGKTWFPIEMLRKIT